MNFLDNQKAIKKLDASSVLESAGLFPDQFKQAWNEVHQLSLPLALFKKTKNILVSGMGGSALGAFIIDSLSFDGLKRPLEIIKGYHLPTYVNQDSLVIVSSYSGNTEETVSCLKEALKRKAKLFLITANGQLEKIAAENNLPIFLLKTPFNPSGQPRMGLGYSIGSQLAFLSRVGFLKLDQSQVTWALNDLQEQKDRFSLDSLLADNPAKKLAWQLKEKMVILIAAEHLIGASHGFKNMLNENSKTFTVRFSLPEMNHHLLEGLAFPKENKKNLKFLFLTSDLYDPKIKKRITITRKVIEENKIETQAKKINGQTRLSQVLSLLYLGSFTSAYLAFLNNLDPAPIPWVDYFKRALKKNHSAHEEKR